MWIIALIEDPGVIRRICPIVPLADANYANFLNTDCEFPVRAFVVLLSPDETPRLHRDLGH